MSEQEPQKIGDYEILGVLGAGGMGQVFKVRNVISDRIEAMKVILPDLAGRQDLADRFLREIKLLAGLNHPNIAALRTALTVNNQLVMIMECVEGTTVAACLERGPLSLSDAVHYTGQVLGALSYAHQRGIIHRDIKPSNMMLTPEGVVKLMDFGIARSVNDSGLTATGETLGSLYYMSPEQVKGQPADARSDLYSLGASLYEMVTGERPFRADSSYSLMAAQIEQPPKPPIAIRADLPAALNEIILLAMAKEPGQRFQSADAFRNALKSSGVATSPVNLPTQTVADPARAAAEAATLSGVPAAKLGTGSAKPVPQPELPREPQPVPSVLALSRQKTSHRGLYMALGGLAVVAFLVAAGIYIPRRDKTRAGERTSSTEPKQSTGSTSTPQAGEAGTQPSANPTPPSAQASGDTGTPTQSQSSKGAMDSGGAAGRAQENRLSSAPDKNARSIAEQVKKAGGRAQVPDAGQSPVPEADAPVQPPPPDNTAALEELEQQLDQLSSRAAAVNDSLESLRKQQAAQGLGLRGDIAATQERLKIHVAKAQAALQGQDINKAKKFAGQAEAELEQLEKFLGR